MRTKKVPKENRPPMRVQSCCENRYLPCSNLIRMAQASFSTSSLTFSMLIKFERAVHGALFDYYK